MLILRIILLIFGAKWSQKWPKGGPKVPNGAKFEEKLTTPAQGMQLLNAPRGLAMSYQSGPIWPTMGLAKV